MIEFTLSCLPDESLSVLLNYTLSKFQFHMCGKVAPEKGSDSSELFCSLPSTQLSHNINNVDSWQILEIFGIPLHID